MRTSWLPLIWVRSQHLLLSRIILVRLPRSDLLTSARCITTHIPWRHPTASPDRWSFSLHHHVMRWLVSEEEHLSCLCPCVMVWFCGDSFTGTLTEESKKFFSQEGCKTWLWQNHLSAPPFFYLPRLTPWIARSSLGVTPHRDSGFCFYKEVLGFFLRQKQHSVKTEIAIYRYMIYIYLYIYIYIYR